MVDLKSSGPNRSSVQWSNVMLPRLFISVLFQQKSITVEIVKNIVVKGFYCAYISYMGPCGMNQFFVFCGVRIGLEGRNLIVPARCRSEKCSHNNAT